MNDILQLLGEKHFVALGFFLIVFSIPLTAIVGSFWVRARKIRGDQHLKQLMIEQGRSAEEIKRILAADSPQTTGRGQSECSRVEKDSA